MDKSHAKFRNIRLSSLWFAILWIALISTLFSWHFSEQRQYTQESFFQVTESLWKQMQIMRWWNAQQGGVFLPISPQVKPNPYLKDKHKILIAENGMTLTKVNPAYMTRQINGLMGLTNSVSIRLFSSHPVNPEGQATPAEIDALNAFAAGQPYVFSIIEASNSESFRYSAPLKVEPSCLTCHENYKTGDIRGGMSVTVRNVPKENLYYVIASYLVLLVAGLIGIWIYYTQVRKAYGLIQEQSLVDPLSRLYNRRYLMEHFDYLLNDSKRQNQPLAVLMCDIDDFKHYNDTFGHLAGDEALVRVANTIKATLKRHTDIAARYGGEEFVVLLPNTSEKGAGIYAARLLDAIEALEIHFTEERRLTLSVGITVWKPGQQQAVEKLIHQADVALYQAKEYGKNQAVFYKPK